MGGTGVIDRFLGVFTQYIDSGFGLLQPEVAFVATTLIAIDITLAALFWSWGGDDDIIARLVKKTLFVGVLTRTYRVGSGGTCWKTASTISLVTGLRVVPAACRARCFRCRRMVIFKSVGC